MKNEAINAHDLGIAGGYIIEDAMQSTINQLKAENAKLRGLVRLLETHVPISIVKAYREEVGIEVG